MRWRWWTRSLTKNKRIVKVRGIMTYKMYLLDINDLEDKDLYRAALTLIDDHRRVLVDKYVVERDRMRAIAAGLLLQIGFLELEAGEEWCEKINITEGIPEIGFEIAGYRWNTENLVKYLQKISVVPLLYREGKYGKPYWNREKLEASFAYKKFWYYNLSHSGDYVVLAVADREIGVDIQEPREAGRYPGGFLSFSRMESFVKCSGDGYAHGYNMYRKYQGNVPGYTIQCLNSVEPYALHICVADHKVENGKEG